LGCFGLFRLFNFYTETASFGVSKKQKTNQNSLIESIFNGVNKNLKIQQFPEIFGSQGAPLVSMTPVAIRHWYQQHQRQICHWCQRHK
jgi:hypothetical protein